MDSMVYAASQSDAILIMSDSIGNLKSAKCYFLSNLMVFNSIELVSHRQKNLNAKGRNS